MSSQLDSLEAEVDALNDGSSIFRFNAALNDLQDAVPNTSDADTPRLRNIISSFVRKIPDLPTYKRVERDADDLANNVMLTTLDQRIKKINARNKALEDLTAALDVQIAKGNKDAKLLGQIKDGIDKATATVNLAKSLINELTDTDASTKDKLKALIDAVAGASTILKAA